MAIIITITKDDTEENYKKEIKFSGRFNKIFEWL
jgi:hypothetical protein